MACNSKFIRSRITGVLFISCLLCTLPSSVAQQADSLTKTHVLKQVTIEDNMEQDFGNLNKIDGMKVTVGKKTEVINVAQLTVNKSSNNTRQIYAKVAGLNIFENDGSGLQLSIGGRGLDPNRSSNFNVRQNGYDISADALGYPESYYTPPAEALSRIEIIKGAASLQFGTQFGGLLNFRMKQPGGAKPFHLELKQSIGSYKFLNSFNSVYGTKGKLSYYAYAHYKRGDGWRPNSKFHSFNTYIDIHYQLNTNNFVGVEYTHLNYLAQQAGGLDDRMFAEDARQSNRERNWFKVNWDLLSIEWESRFSEVTKLETKVSGLIASRNAIGYRANRPSQIDNGTAPRDLLQGTFQNLTLESRLMHHYMFFQKRQTLLTGVRAYGGYNKSLQGDVANGNGANFNFNRPREVLSDYTFPNGNLAFFAENVFRILPNWGITPGIRYEFIRTQSNGHYKEITLDMRDSIIDETINSEQRILPRSFLIAAIGSSLQLRPDLEFYGNISQNYRSVTFSDIQVRYASFEIDPAISDEKGWSADLGTRGNIHQVLTYDMSTFYLHYGNRIGEYFFEKDNGQVIRKRGNVGVANIYGLESYLELDIMRLLRRTGKGFQLTLYNNLALTHSIYAKSMLANVQGNQLEYVPSVNWKAGLQCAYKQLKFTSQFSHLTEQYTDATNAVDGGYSGVNGLLPAYSLIDLSAGWYGNIISVEASVNNLLNSIYATRRATGYPGPGIIPGDGRGFFLTLGCKL